MHAECRELADPMRSPDDANREIERPRLPQTRHSARDRALTLVNRAFDRQGGRSDALLRDWSEFNLSTR